MGEEKWLETEGSEVTRDDQGKTRVAARPQRELPYQK